MMLSTWKKGHFDEVVDPTPIDPKQLLTSSPASQEMDNSKKEEPSKEVETTVNTQSTVPRYNHEQRPTVEKAYLVSETTQQDLPSTKDTTIPKPHVPMKPKVKYLSMMSIWKLKPASLNLPT